MENNLINEYFTEVKNVFLKINTEKIELLANKIREVKKNGGVVFVIGNGGSASTSSHLSCDLMKNTISNYDSHKNRLKVVSLTDNIAIISAYGNDISYDEIFSQQLKSLVNKNDLLIAISGSGNSGNIMKAVEFSKQQGIFVFGLLGGNGGHVLPMCNESIVVNSNNYGVIEDLHMMIGHMVTVLLKGKNNFIP